MLLLKNSNIWSKHDKNNTGEEAHWGIRLHCWHGVGACCYKLEAAEVCGHKRIKTAANEQSLEFRARGGDCAVTFGLVLHLLAWEG